VGSSLRRRVVSRCSPQMVGVLIVTLTLFSFRHSNKVANQECICHLLYPKWFRRFCFPEMKIIKLIFLLIFVFTDKRFFHMSVRLNMNKYCFSNLRTIYVKGLYVEHFSSTRRHETSTLLYHDEIQATSHQRSRSFRVIVGNVRKLDVG